MTIHLHTLCWNDRRMLDYFFRHYEPWVDHFYLLDDGSTDGTREYLDQHPKVSVERLQRVNPGSWILSAQYIYDNVWKQSRGQADWVIVTNIDEHLYHPDMQNYLAHCGATGITAVPALGYQMISEVFPSRDAVLTRDVRHGMPWRQMNKLSIFNPDKIDNTNFAPGRHRAQFSGDVRFPERDEVLNLHFKYMGMDYTSNRHSELLTGLREIDRERGWGHKYAWDEAQLNQDFAAVMNACVDVTDVNTDHQSLHEKGRWWR